MVCKANSCGRPAREDGYCLSHSPERQRVSRKANAERFKGYTLKRDYGIAYEQYQELLKQQDGRCAICNETPTDKKLAVDHSHATGVVRGLLCSACNVGLGHFKDSIELLSKAVEYLNRPAPKVNAFVADSLLEELLKL
jgi:hypothetical protein